MQGRAAKHDKSKLEEPEAQWFEDFKNRLNSVTYGSDEYKELLTGLKPALDHHYASNSHHPEHFSNGVDGMNLADLVEMFCDWYAATKRHADGDIYRSIEINTKRFNLSPQLASIFKNTADEWRGKDL